MDREEIAFLKGQGFTYNSCSYSYERGERSDIGSYTREDPIYGKVQLSLYVSGSAMALWFPPGEVNTSPYEDNHRVFRFFKRQTDTAEAFYERLETGMARALGDAYCPTERETAFLRRRHWESVGEMAWRSLVGTRLAYRCLYFDRGWKWGGAYYTSLYEMMAECGAPGVAAELEE